MLVVSWISEWITCYDIYLLIERDVVRKASPFHRSEADMKKGIPDKNAKAVL
jgi:hypothetical protein